eukprot:763284-Hanusia_phi.AAC.1
MCNRDSGKHARQRQEKPGRAAYVSDWRNGDGGEPGWGGVGDARRSPRGGRGANPDGRGASSTMKACVAVPIHKGG